jgi:hypothetical protein
LHASLASKRVREVLDEAAGGRQRTRDRSGGLEHGRVGAADRARSTRRRARLGPRRGRRIPRSARCVPAKNGGARLERGPQSPDRPAMGRGRSGRRPQRRSGARRSSARADRRSRQRCRRTGAPGDPHHPDRLHDRSRSHRRRFRREPFEAWRQRHRVCELRLQHRRQVGGDAQGDLARPQARRRRARSRHHRRHRAVERHPGRRSLAWPGTKPDHRAGRVRCRAGDPRPGAVRECRAHRHLGRRSFSVTAT